MCLLYRPDLGEEVDQLVGAQARGELLHENCTPITLIVSGLRRRATALAGLTAAVIATVGIILAALYILLMYKRMATGPVPDSASGTRDLGSREKWVVAPLIALFLVLGFYPKPALDMINPAVSTTLGYMGVVDPAPIVPVNAEGGAK